MTIARQGTRLRLQLQRRGLLWLSAAGSRMRRRAAEHLLTGERGELEALFYLRREGYTVVARRWRTADLNGDLDLIAWDGGTLCFVEVKSRSSRDRTPAALAIDGRKRRMLARMARAYLRTLPRSKVEAEMQEPMTRLDIVSVYLLPEGPEFELIRDAFDWRSYDFAGSGV